MKQTNMYIYIYIYIFMCFSEYPLFVVLKGNQRTTRHFGGPLKKTHAYISVPYVDDIEFPPWSFQIE